MSNYPQALYRDGSEFEWDGLPLDVLFVADEAAHETAKLKGWRTAADILAAPAKPHPPLSLLDRSAKDIEAVLPELTIEELEALKADETAGKTRKGVLAAIESAIDAKLAA